MRGALDAMLADKNFYRSPRRSGRRTSIPSVSKTTPSRRIFDRWCAPSSGRSISSAFSRRSTPRTRSRSKPSYARCAHPRSSCGERTTSTSDVEWSRWLADDDPGNEAAHRARRRAVCSSRRSARQCSTTGCESTGRKAGTEGRVGAETRAHRTVRTVIASVTSRDAQARDHRVVVSGKHSSNRAGRATRSPAVWWRTRTFRANDPIAPLATA